MTLDEYEKATQKKAQTDYDFLFDEGRAKCLVE